MIRRNVNMPLGPQEIIARIAEQRGISIEAARQFYRRTESREMDEARQVIARPERAGNPTYRPRDDFNGTPRRT